MHLPACFVALVSLAAPTLAAVSFNATPFIPPSVPLAVRSPYLSAWLPQGHGTALNGDWPRFWTGSIVGWAGLATVDGVGYNWMGNPGIPGATANKATQKSLQFTSTQSTFVMTAGPVDLTITFLSPVEPSDLVNQSLPFSYYAVSASSNDGKTHSVQVYADMSAEWISGDNNLIVNWNTTTGNVLTHELRLASPSPFNEISDRIQDGTAYHSTLNTVGATYQIGEDIVVRALFLNNSKLANTIDTNFRAVSDRWPVFAHAHDLGTVTASPSAPVVFSIGYVRDPVLQYITTNDGTQVRSSYFWTRFTAIGDAISTFLNDYKNALARAKAFDDQVDSDATKISADYASIVALSIRQALATIEITVSQNSDRSFNASDVLTFMKEISSDGNVNTVDVIYPAWPLFLYTNPEIGKQLLLPLLDYQASGQYPNAWSVHDVGAHYPNATGHNDGKDVPMPVEESGNMVIMALSYTQKTNDTSLVKTYFNLLDQWTQFLITDSLVPANQLSTDDFAGTLANQTNLAIKGIVGIKAMAKIAEIVGDSARSTNYSSIADSYVQQWEKLAVAPDGTHLTLSYGNTFSWGLSYNLYADKLLGTNAFPESIYDMQTSWYSARPLNTYGLPLDTRHTFTKSDWQIWTAGFVTSSTVRDELISAVRKYAANGMNNQPLGDLYESVNGTTVLNSGRARPVVGGHLALLALSNTSLPASVPSSSGTSTSPPSPTSGSNTDNGSATGTTDGAASPTTKSNAGRRDGQHPTMGVLLAIVGAIVLVAHC